MSWKYGIVQLNHPKLEGGRIDIGMVSKFTTTWISDWVNMPRNVRILNGMSMALPPEYLNRTFAAIEGSNADTQMHVAIMAHPTIIGVAHTLAEANPILMEIVCKYIRIYK